MNRKDTVYVNNDFCIVDIIGDPLTVSQAKILKNKEHKSSNCCAVCQNQVIAGDNVLLLINNNKLFPNCLVHSECYREGEFGTVYSLAENYKDYESERDDIKRNFWFKGEIY